MNSEQEKIIAKAKEYIKTFFDQEFSGHDFFHSMRVFSLATKIAEEENADIFLVQLIALLHDVDDKKIVGEQKEKMENAIRFMQENGLTNSNIEKVCNCIEAISFKGSGTSIPELIEGKIVQDADRMDAIGALGIARAFAFGGNKNRMIYDPNEKPILEMDEQKYRNNKGCSINHFYEKLLLLKDMMNTETAKRMAKERHRFMEEYLEEFFLEWKGEK